jgi:hypothetical protein
MHGMARLFGSIWPWLVTYVVILCGIAFFTIHLRDTILTDNAETANSWEQWRQAEIQREGEPGPIQRAPPKSHEPPMVVLMRDNFGVILGASIIFPGIIIGFLIIVVRGVLRQSSSGTPSKP